MFKTKHILLLVSFVLILAGCNDHDNSDTGADEKTVILLNEFKSNIPEDIHALQYIELRGTENHTIKNTYLVVIDGDEDNEGIVDYAYNLDGVTIGSNGLIIIKNENKYNDVVSAETTVINEPLIKTYVDDDEHKDGILEHDAVTYILIKTTSTIAIGDDLDTDNDGVLDLADDAEILDSVGSLDGGSGFVYGGIVLNQSASDPDAATRFYGNLTANSLSAWANGDIYEDPGKNDEEMAEEVLYDTLEASSNLPPNAKLTPGNHNFKEAPFVVLNEIVNSGDKYVELLSNASQSFTSIYLVLISDQEGKASISLDLSDYAAKQSGISVIKDTHTTFAVGSSATSITADLSALTQADSSVVLIYSPKASITAGDDLDTDNDGNLDLDDNAVQLDSFGWGSSLYSVVTADNSSYAIQGATRYKDNRMASKSAWTYGSLDGVNYVAEDSKNVPENGYVTPANINISEAASVIVTPVIETERSTISNPDADDIAFWIHPDDSSKSLVIATQKDAGYSIYNVDGETLIDALPDENRYNNVDVMYNFELNGERIDFALFTDRNNNKFAIYKIQETAPYIVDITDYDSDELFDAQEPGEDTAYGEGIYKSPVSGRFYAFATQNGTWNVAQFELVANNNTIGWTKVRTITLEAGDDDEHAEGIVVDQEYGKAYIAQEGVGIYTIDAEPGDSPSDIALGEDDMIAEEGSDNLVADLEGMTIYYKDDGTGYVFISSQGNIVYGVYDRTTNGVPNTYLTSFIIADDMEGIDGTQHTDSIDVTNIPLSGTFPYGAFIAQDGSDTTISADDTGTNFKWVKWEDIATGLGDVTFESSYDPRTPENRR
ncbi:phytase [uncultured Desulfobacter sp.]|uniref:phytase n=1 Tax=uncultured Desulfobacter sp. TaxID=240139 RepID=UPI002AAB59FE|nr:phytase [uncultured Desulfobacter sp.]